MFDYPELIKRGWIGNFVRNILYEKFRWPIYPLFGGFPVKMTTYIGEPYILTESDHINAIDLGKEIKTRMRQLIKTHQKVNLDTTFEPTGFIKNTIMGLVQRFQRVKDDFAQFRDEVFSPQTDQPPAATHLHND